MTVERIAACPPVDVSRLKQILPDLPVPIYEHAEKGTCVCCGVEIWIGPRIGLMIQISPTLTYCYLCATGYVQTQKLMGGRLHLQTLGNEPSDHA